MPDWWPALLLGVFVTHLPFFAWRWLRTREPRHAATSVTFALLTATYSLQVFAPELRIAGVLVHPWVRRVAWAAAALSIGLLLRHLLRTRARKNTTQR